MNKRFKSPNKIANNDREAHIKKLKSAIDADIRAETKKPRLDKCDIIIETNKTEKTNHGNNNICIGSTIRGIANNKFDMLQAIDEAVKMYHEMKNEIAHYERAVAERRWDVESFRRECYYDPRKFAYDVEQMSERIMTEYMDIIIDELNRMVGNSASAAERSFLYLDIKTAVEHNEYESFESSIHSWDIYKNLKGHLFRFSSETFLEDAEKLRYNVLNHAHWYMADIDLHKDVAASERLIELNKAYPQQIRETINGESFAVRAKEFMDNYSVFKLSISQLENGIIPKDFPKGYLEMYDYNISKMLEDSYRKFEFFLIQNARLLSHEATRSSWFLGEFSGVLGIERYAEENRLTFSADTLLADVERAQNNIANGKQFWWLS
jgi:hypothetical protein